MTRFRASALTAAMALCMCFNAAAAVKVEGGLVEGTAEEGLTVYRGIPFAAPPVGDLRWRAPQPAAKWEGVLKADHFAPMCVQNMPGMPGMPPGDVRQSEDCLYLNVRTPAKSASERIPVLVWIYGGGFNGGATSIPMTTGERLAKKDVVLVSIAYRVGVFGFLAHPGLSAETKNHVSCNYGLLDMIAALQWIQRDIASFGGDPRRVTIFGESAGGIAVSMLCASPLAKGLFHGAISQSGGSFGPPRKGGMPGENMQLLSDAELAGSLSPRKPVLRPLPNFEAFRWRRCQPPPSRAGWHGRLSTAGSSRTISTSCTQPGNITTHPFWWATTPMRASASPRRAPRWTTSKAFASGTARSRTDC